MLFGTSDPFVWPPARVPFMYRGEGFYRNRTDVSIPKTATIASTGDNSGGCTRYDVPEVRTGLLSLSDAPLLGYVPPILATAGPLHMERIP